MICTECGKSYTGSNCRCRVKKTYGDDSGSEPKLNAQEERHYKMWMKYRLSQALKDEAMELLDEMRLRRCTAEQREITQDFGEMKLNQAKQLHHDFIRESAGMAMEFIKTPWWMQCNGYEHGAKCTKFGGLSTSVRKDGAKFCKTHFNA